MKLSSRDRVYTNGQHESSTKSAKASKLLTYDGFCCERHSNCCAGFFVPSLYHQSTGMVCIRKLNAAGFYSLMREFLLLKSADQRFETM